MIVFRKLTLADEVAYRAFEKAMLEDKKVNPYVEWWHVEDFPKFVTDNHQSEQKQEGQSWSTYTRYFAFLDGHIVGFLICFWEIDHPDCQKLGHVGYMVAPAYRRQGLGRRFLTFAKDRYREKGMASVLLVTDQANIASRGLIEQLGGQLVALEEIDHLEKSLQAARYQLRTEDL